MSREITSAYLAARTEWKPLMREVASKLDKIGIRVTSRWIQDSFDEGKTNREKALLDLEDVHEGDILILFTDKGEGVGRHIEFGYARGKGKRLFVVGSPESIFHSLPRVTNFPTIEHLISSLENKITAFNEEGEEWILTPTLRKGGLRDQDILELQGPIGYYLDSFPEIFERVETRGLENFCIDARGRNFGSKS